MNFLKEGSAECFKKQNEEQKLVKAQLEREIFDAFGNFADQTVSLSYAILLRLNIFWRAPAFHTFHTFQTFHRSLICLLGLCCL